MKTWKLALLFSASFAVGAAAAYGWIAVHPETHFTSPLYAPAYYTTDPRP